MPSSREHANAPIDTSLSTGQGFLQATVFATSDRRWLCGFTAAILYAAGCCLLALRQAFATPYTFADDAREHVFWMARYLDPDLLSNDLSADYFQTLAPHGYAGLYWLLARAGIDPLLASKCLPSILSLIAVGYFFGLSRRFLRSPAAATLATLLFVQCLWLNSDLSSATPRAFFYPLFIAFLYYQMRGSAAGVLVAVGLEALFFPPAALLSLGVLGWDRLHWDRGLKLAKDARAYLLLAAASVIVLLCLAPYLHQTGKFGPPVSYDQARQMPEFGPDGRVPVFLSSWWGYWVGGNAGVHNFPLNPPWFLFALFWPVLRYFLNRFPALAIVPRGARPIPQTIAASLTLFASAHILMFRLYLPNRYTQSVMRVVLILLAGGVIFALVDAAIRCAGRFRPTWEATLAKLGVAAALLTILAYPLLLPEFPRSSYVKGAHPDLYQFFKSQPATIRIASLADEANNLPLLCRRSNIVGAECAVPFHPDYYLPLRNRGLEIARAQYSSDPEIVQQCVRDLKVDFWLLERKAFNRKYWKKSRLLRQLRLSKPAEALGEKHETPPFLQWPPAGSIAYEDARFLVLDARRLLKAPHAPRAEATQR
ncbi:hypothetical protein BH20VER3_BH20VER3_10840 [soil metagenome]